MYRYRTGPCPSEFVETLTRVVALLCGSGFSFSFFTLTQIWNAPGLHFKPSGLHCERPRPSTPLFCAFIKLLNFDFNPDPAFDPNADPDRTFKNNVDPDPQLYIKPHLSEYLPWDGGREECNAAPPQSWPGSSRRMGRARCRVLPCSSWLSPSRMPSRPPALRPGRKNALKSAAELRIHDILVWIRIRGSMVQTNGSGYESF